MSTELLSICLPDGQIVNWTVQEVMRYEGEWQVNLAHLTSQELEQGIARLKGCLAHGNDVTCEVCSDD